MTLSQMLALNGYVWGVEEAYYAALPRWEVRTATTTVEHV
jgi:hypothetical protein